MKSLTKEEYDNAIGFLEQEKRKTQENLIEHIKRENEMISLIESRIYYLEKNK